MKEYEWILSLFDGWAIDIFFKSSFLPYNIFNRIGSRTVTQMFNTLYHFIQVLLLAINWIQCINKSTYSLNDN